MINVKCFGVAKEIVKSETLKVNDSIHTVKDLREAIHNSFPDFTRIKGFMIAVNQEYATDDMKISDSDEIAIIPPVSGG